MNAMKRQEQLAHKEVIIAGHPCHVFVPEQRNPYGWTVVFLHDVDGAGLDGRGAYLQVLARHGLPCIAPISGRSWWTERIWPEFDAAFSAEVYVIKHVLDYVAEQWQSRPPQVAMLGIGMGGQGALKISFKYPNRLPIVAAVAPALDFQLAYYDEDETALPAIYPEPEAARQDTAILHVHPLNWPRNLWFAANPADDRWYSGAERLKMKLSALGIPHDADLETSAVGQSRAYTDLVASPAVDYLVERLEREHRRVGT
jgi:pimeloyl-ACP methyl ester carboxylesterase